jgi:hypothetical protein
MGMAFTVRDESSYLSSTSDTFLLAADSPADKMKQIKSFCKLQAYSCHSSCSYTQIVVIHTAATMQIVLIHPETIVVHVDSSHSCCSYLQIVVIYLATKTDSCHIYHSSCSCTRILPFICSYIYEDSCLLSYSYTQIVIIHIAAICR